MPNRREDEERERIRNLVTALYAEGYADGMGRVAESWPERTLQHVPAALEQMGGKVSVRLDLVDKAVDSYLEAIERHGVTLRQAGVTGDHLRAEVMRYAEELSRNKAQLITEMEWAKARMDGAGTIVNESGEKFEWRFPHFETAAPDHEECVICEAIRQRSPYSSEEAELEGYPDLPHPNCDHGWVLVPKGEGARTEEHPQDNQKTRGDIPHRERK